MNATFTRASLLDWLRSVAPDLRIGKAVIDGERVCFAKFTVNGVEHELSAPGDDDDDAIVRVAVDAARESMGMPPLIGTPRLVQLEQDIVRASLDGDDSARDALVRQLFAARSPRRIQAKTSFSKRYVW